MMNKEVEGFCYLRQMFPRVTDTKIKKGIFVGPEIRDIINDKPFEDLLVGLEKITWRAFKYAIENFLGNCRTPNYIHPVDKMLGHYLKCLCILLKL